MINKPTYEELEQRVQELERTAYEHNHTKEELGDREMLLQSLVQSPVTINIACLDTTYCYLFFNNVHKAAVRSAWSAEVELGTNLLGYITDKDDRASALLNFDRVLAGETFTITQKFGNIERHIWESSYSPITGPDGKIRGLSVFSIDITERKLAEEMLRKSELWMRGIFNSLDESILVLTPDRKLVNVNPATSRIFGYSENELINQSTEVLHVDNDHYVDFGKKINKSFDKNQMANFEFKAKKKNGEVFFSEHTVSQIKNDSGEFVGIVSIVRDISERKQLEEKLKLNAEKFERWKASSPIGIIQSNARGGINDVNDTVLTMLGYSRQDLLDGNLDWTKLTPPEFLHLDKKAMEESADKGFWTPFEKEYFHKDGHRVPIIIGGSVFKEYADEYIVFIIDITTIKQAEASVRKSEKKYRMLFENMAQGVFYQNADGELIDFNQNALDMFGLTKDQFLGKTSFDPEWKVIHEGGSDFPANQHPSMIALRTGKPVLDITAGVFNPFKRDFVWLSINAIPQFKNGDSKPYQVFVTLHDITDLKKADEELRQAHKMESIGTMAGGIAHDFNNLLHMIIGNTELALEDIPEWNPAHESLEEIKSASLRAAGIVKQLLNFSRKTDQDLKPMGAVTIIKDSLKFLRSTIPSTVKFELNLPDTDIPILGDPIQINQIMMNLCVNASQFLQDTRGTIKIDVKTVILNEEDAKDYANLSAGNHIKITVSDSGPGIAPDILDLIFDPYFTTKKFGAGSGMGLAVVHGNVKNHGGAIFVDNKPGEGATFNIFFPVIDELPEPKIEVKEDIPHGTETILFVDDEEFIVNMTGKTLERLGYQIEKRLNPVEALELFKSNPDVFDLVITDMTMPQMTGAELAEKLKKIRSDIPVIICTGHSAIIDEEKAKRLGIEGLVMKPVSKLKIAKAIREILDK